MGQPARSWEKEGTMERYGVVWKKKGRWYSVRAREIRGSMVSVGLLASDRNALLPTYISHGPGYKDDINRVPFHQLIYSFGV